jgi:hypothetical protein
MPWHCPFSKEGWTAQEAMQEMKVKGFHFLTSFSSALGLPIMRRVSPPLQTQPQHFVPCGGCMHLYVAEPNAACV